MADLDRPALSFTEADVQSLIADSIRTERASDVVREALHVALTRMHDDAQTIAALRAQLAACRREQRDAQ